MIFREREANRMGVKLLKASLGKTRDPLAISKALYSACTQGNRWTPATILFENFGVTHEDLRHMVGHKVIIKGAGRDNRAVFLFSPWVVSMFRRRILCERLKISQALSILTKHF